MATSTTYLSLIKPEATDTDKIRENFNTNMDTIDGRFSSTYMAVQDKSNVTITGGTITGITDLNLTNISMTGELDITGANAIIDLNPAQVGTVQVINITPTAVLTTSEATWRGILINGNALDPSGNDIGVYGICLEFSTFSPSGTGVHVDGYKVTMADITQHGLHIINGKVVIEGDIPSTAIAEFTGIDIRYGVHVMNATSELHAIDVAVTEGTPAGDIVAVGTHSHVDVIHQHIGTFASPVQSGANSFAGIYDNSETNYTAGINTVEMFVANSDAIWLGDGDKFDELEVDMSSDATKTISPTFWYWKASAWEQFYPADDTDGFQHSGLIRWVSGDLTGWSSADPADTEGATGYWMKVVRTANADPGTPTALTVKIGAITIYSWSKTGDLTVKDIDANDIDAASLVLDTPLIPAEGGTGVENGANNTITFTGNFTLGITLTANTAIQLPTSGTLVNTAVTSLSSLATIGTVTSGTLSTGAVLADVTMTLGSDADGDIYYRSSSKLTRLAKGTDGYFLKIGASIPEWAVPAGAGDVSKVGTPANSQVGVWTGDGTIEGDASLTYDGSNLQLTGDIGSTGTRITKGWFVNLELDNVPTVGGTALPLKSDKLDVFAATSSSELAGVITGETGTGALVFGTSPIFTTQITTPKVLFDDGQGIYALDGHEQLLFGETGSAINYLKITNSATTDDVVIETDGDDTNIDLQLKAKGTGNVFVNDNLYITGTGNVPLRLGHSTNQYISLTARRIGANDETAYYALNAYHDGANWQRYSTDFGSTTISLRASSAFSKAAISLVSAGEGTIAWLDALIILVDFSDNDTLVSINSMSNQDPHLLFKENLTVKWDIYNDNADDNLQIKSSTTLRYEFGTDGTAVADEAWNTFSPIIAATGRDLLGVALEDANKPVKPYKGIPHIVKDENLYDIEVIEKEIEIDGKIEIQHEDKKVYHDRKPDEFRTKAEVDLEFEKYSKSPAKIAIANARYLEHLTGIIDEMQSKIESLEGKKIS